MADMGGLPRFSAVCPQCGEPYSAAACGFAHVLVWQSIEMPVREAEARASRGATEAAYEQAAKRCEERAAKIRQRGRERPAAYGGDAEGVASWIDGCADTIRHKDAATLWRALPPTERSGL